MLQNINKVLPKTLQFSSEMGFETLSSCKAFGRYVWNMKNFSLVQVHIETLLRQCRLLFLWGYLDIFWGKKLSLFLEKTFSFKQNRKVNNISFNTLISKLHFTQIFL